MLFENEFPKIFSGRKLSCDTYFKINKIGNSKIGKNCQKIIFINFSLKLILKIYLSRNVVSMKMSFVVLPSILRNVAYIDNKMLLPHPGGKAKRILSDINSNNWRMNKLLSAINGLFLINFGNE